MNNFLLSIFILIILSLAAYPIFKSKERGIKCIGCAHAQNKACSCDDSFITRHQPTWVELYKEDKKRQNV
jgi:hypothetical protein